TLTEEFSKESGYLKDRQTPPNPWGLYDMHGNVEEWCYDWYGPYQRQTQTDPVGRVTGDFRVTRGGSHSTSPYYLRSANRLGTVPEDKHTLIGFRVVIGEMPETEPLPKSPLALYQTGVSQQVPSNIEKGPNPKEPYFHKPHQFVKMPAGNRGPLYFKHNHFTSVTECPNGDLIAIWHTCIGESGRELAIAASRLRYGKDQWEPASLFWDAPDRNDHGHALWFDGKDKIYHFQGLADRSRNVALVMRTSADNAATWSAPRIIADHGPSRMPVESVFRTKEGFYALSCDKGPNILWISHDQGISWIHPGGRIRGKHAPAVQLTDGRLMALGRERDIDGKMPMSISGDMGKTWEYSASEFPPVSWGQRAVLLRLKQGPLFFASFCKKMMVKNASGSHHQVSGLFGTVSFDDGKTWPHKRLVTDDCPGRDIETLNGDPITISPHNTESVGYLAVCQTADNIIHLLTSRQHYAFNLKWLTTLPPMAPAKPTPPNARPLPNKDRLEKVYWFGDASGRNRWTWKSEDFTQERPDEVTSRTPFKITAGNGGFYERNEDPAGFGAVDQKKGFTVEIRTQVVSCSPNAKGVDIELYDGAGSRYALAITDTAVYWYEGYIQGSAFLPLAEFIPVAEGLDNTDAMHTYRIAARPDRVAQIYRDGQFIAVRKCEYRTPRDAYIQLGVGPGAEALVEYFAYDLTGPFQP
ncbi:MAG: SUMF1/EgtB/PvdO family nonheme iron enzyme, partial [Planctomycetota bacterium]